MNQETTTSLIDTALAAGSATALDPEERQLQELVLTIRDDAPSPQPDFKLRMDARVAAGFPRRRSSGGAAGPSGAAAGASGALGERMRALFAKRPRLAAMGAAASVLVALIVAISVLGNGSDSPTKAFESSAKLSGSGAASTASGESAAKAAPQSSDSAAAQSAPDVAGAPAPSSRTAVPGSGGVTESVAPLPPQQQSVVGGTNRKVERSAAIVLAPAKDKMSEVGDQVIAVTDRYRGFVMNSSVTTSADQNSSGSFDLRIPARSLRPALRDLSGLADVKSRTENANDVTASFVNARTRLEELGAERRGLLRRLEKATTDQEAAALRARIRIVNAQIDAAQASLGELRRRTNYAVVSVALEAKPDSSGGSTGGIGSGARDLRDSLVDAANLSLRVLGVALPIAILIALLWGASGWLTRRRREAVLDTRH